MSKNGINLLSQRAQVLAKRRLIENIKKGSIVLIVIYIGFVIAVYVVSMLLTQQSADVRNRIITAEKRIKANQKTESLEIALKERMKSVVILVNSDMDAYYNQIFEVVRSLSFIPGISLSSVSIDKTKLVLGFSAQDVDKLTSFVDILKSDTSKYQSVDIGPFVRSRKGEYNFSFQAVIIP